MGFKQPAGGCTPRQAASYHLKWNETRGPLHVRSQCRQCRTKTFVDHLITSCILNLFSQTWKILELLFRLQRHHSTLAVGVPTYQTANSPTFINTLTWQTLHTFRTHSIHILYITLTACMACRYYIHTFRCWCLRACVHGFAWQPVQPIRGTSRGGQFDATMDVSTLSLVVSSLFLASTNSNQLIIMIPYDFIIKQHKKET